MLELGLGFGIVGLGVVALNWLVGVLPRRAHADRAGARRHVAFCFALLAGVLIENLTEYEFFRPGDILWVLFVVAVTHLGRAGLTARAARRESRAPVRPVLPLARAASSLTPSANPRFGPGVYETSEAFHGWPGQARPR